MYILDHITQENGKWFAEIKNEEITKKRTHRKYMGMGWNELQFFKMYIRRIL